MNKYPTQRNQENNRNNTEDKKQKEKFVRTNWKIKAPQCRLVENGKEPRIMPTRQALEYAQNLNLDLVELSYDFRSGISTCRICDYGKFVYEQKQREKAAKKQARANQVDLKCLQMSLTTDTADLNRMIDRAKEFLQGGDRVKISLRFRGRRELENLEMGKDIMKTVLANFDGLAVLDSAPTLNGKELGCILRKAVQKKQPETKRESPKNNITIKVS